MTACNTQVSGFQIDNIINYLFQNFRRTLFSCLQQETRMNTAVTHRQILDVVELRDTPALSRVTHLRSDEPLLSYQKTTRVGF